MVSGGDHQGGVPSYLTGVAGLPRFLAGCLLVAVARLFGLFGSGEGERRAVPMAVALGIGALLGLVSGVIGIGGGILLSPLLLLFRWADAKTTAATSALFILVNSLAGLAGLWSNGATLDPRMLTWVGVALVGGVTVAVGWLASKVNCCASTVNAALV